MKHVVHQKLGKYSEVESEFCKASMLNSNACVLTIFSSLWALMLLLILAFPTTAGIIGGACFRTLKWT